MEEKLELLDEEIYPDTEVLRGVLEDSYGAFVDIMDLFHSKDLTHEWRFYKDGKAWLCKVQKKKRTIVWMSVWRGFFKATIYFPLRLLDKVMELDLKEETKQSIDSTKNVGKSKPCTFEIRSPEILGEFQKIMDLKIHTK